MMPAAKYLWAALGVAVLTHLVVVNALPGALMGAAIERLSQDRFNAWRFTDRVTPLSRGIVRPSPDFAYSVCPYDLSRGPVSLQTAAWDDYWSLSLYADNSDNFHVVNDKDAPHGADLTLIAPGAALPDVLTPVVGSPSLRGIALLRRLAPSIDRYNAAARAAQGDVCAPLAG
jgi:uncharacterized membrane protein